MIHHLSPESHKSNLLSFHGIYDAHNRERLLQFLGNLDPKMRYTLLEYDISGNPYHSGPKEVSLLELQRTSSYSHASHRYEIQDEGGSIVCSIAISYPSISKNVPAKVARILH